MSIDVGQTCGAARRGGGRVRVVRVEHRRCPPAPTRWVTSRSRRTTSRCCSRSRSGVAVRVLDGGDRMELRLDGATNAVVMGYQGEPMLRLTGGRRRGEPPTRRRSTSAEPAPATRPPTRLGHTASAEPEWVRTTIRAAPPLARPSGALDEPAPAPRRGPRSAGDHIVVIPKWDVPVVVDGHDATLTGDLTWLPPPSPWPWWIGIAVATVGAAALGWLWWRPSRWVGAALLTVGSAITAAGAFTDEPRRRTRPRARCPRPDRVARVGVGRGRAVVPRARAGRDRRPWWARWDRSRSSPGRASTCTDTRS